MEQITKSYDVQVKKNIINRVSEVPGGVSLALADLVAGKIVEEGTPITAPSSGLRTVCKQAKILTGSTTTVFRVKSKYNNFKVGEYLMRIEGGLAYAITAIGSEVGTDADGDLYDTITVGTALESATVGEHIYQADAESATNTSALENEADAILKEPFVVPSTSQVIWMNGAYLRADVVEGFIGSLHLDDLNVQEVKY